MLHCISTHAPLAGHDKIGVLCPYCVIWISTHAPLAGHDGRPASRALVHIPHFNPRAPCGARLPRLQLCRRAGQISTHAPLAGHDDRSVGVPSLALLYFNPRAPCGARPLAGRDYIEKQRFQPTRPLRGTTAQRRGCAALLAFQPTRPLRGTTGVLILLRLSSEIISTHAPLAGHDGVD